MKAVDSGSGRGIGDRDREIETFTRTWAIDGRTGFLVQEVRKMSAMDRRKLLKCDHEILSIRRQCQLLSVMRSRCCGHNLRFVFSSRRHLVRRDAERMPADEALASGRI
ncbi:MAG TPA: hypothetical protein VLC51_05255 [Nitrospira sp.]|nr:hypothetical protein [Nitrospira sp.]